jgi:hypothetical protein
VNHNNTLPAGANTAAVATTLNGDGLLSSATLKYGGVAVNGHSWTYTIGTGAVDTSGC